MQLDRVLFIVLSDWVLYRVFLRVLTDRSLFRVLDDMVILTVLDPWVFCRSSVLVFQYAVCYQLHQHICIGFALIFCFTHFRGNRYFYSFLGKFNAITGNLDKLLTKEKSFILDFWLGSKYTCAESSVFRSIYPELYQKIDFLKGFSKISRKVSWT